jgi:hypothetical protein
MSPAAITAKIHQPLDIHGYFPAPVTFDDVVVLDHLTDPIHVVTAEVVAVHRVGKINRI